MQLVNNLVFKKKYIYKLFFRFEINIFLNKHKKKRY